MTLITKATVFAPGDPSVGIPASHFELDVSVLTDEHQEEMREQIKELYDAMTGDNCRVLWDFEVEQLNRNEAADEIMD